MLSGPNWVLISDIFECFGKLHLLSEGTLPTDDDLLGYKLEAVHDVADLDLSHRILLIYPQTQLP